MSDPSFGVESSFKRLSLATLMLGASCVALCASPAFANTDTWTAADAMPSFKVLKGAPISPAAAAGFYATPGNAPLGLCGDYPTNSQLCLNGALPRSPEVRELARALSKQTSPASQTRTVDPDLVYEYIRNTISTEFVFGLHKGAMGVLIDKSGGAFDQAHLMVEVLREGGVTARYRFGEITLTGQQFFDWSGVQSAKAACELLAAGGIPAIVNQSSASCDLTGNVSTVTLSHVWVEAVVGGQTYQYDPSLKSSEQRAGLDVRSAMGLQPGQVLSAATGGVSRSSDGKAASGYGLDAVATKLSGYMDAMTTRLSATDMNGASMTDVVGGPVIIPAERPAGGWGQASLSYATASATWTSIPNTYRTVLTVTANNVSGGALLNASFFLDEIYGRKLQIIPGASSIGAAPVLYFDGVKLVQGAGFPLTANDKFYTFIGRIAVNHPFAASSGTQGDGALERKLFLDGPIAIVHGWGTTSAGLASKLSAENAVSALSTPSGAVSNTEILGYVGAATWLSDFSTAARIHGRLANAAVTSLHTIGFSFAFGTGSTDYEPDYDTVQLLDLSSLTAVTALDGDAVKRRSAIRALAATAAALEGAVYEQLSENPDSASTARRFAWANRPDAAAFGDNWVGPLYLDYRPDPEATSRAPIPFRYFSGSDLADKTLFTPANDPRFTVDLRVPMSSAINAYRAKNYVVTAASDASMGPGAASAKVSDGGAYISVNTPQRGAAFVATLYDDAGDPLEIAHVVMNHAIASKGGGAGAKPGGPPDSTQMLKDKFVDRSSSVGIDLLSGRASFPGRTVRIAGSGEFPYRIEESLAIKGQTLAASYDSASARDPGNLQKITGGLISSFDGGATFSSSTAEGMGASRVEAAAPTLAAFAALQDTFAAAASSPADRDVAAALIADWWTRRQLDNVVTVSQGADAQQFVRSGWEAGAKRYIPATGGPARVLSTGEPGVVRPIWTVDGEAIPAQKRIKLWHPVSVRLLTGQGAEKTYKFWSMGWYERDASAQPLSDPNFFYRSYVSGFRLDQWKLDRGVSLTINYPPIAEQRTGANYSIAAEGAAIPVSVTSSLGRTLVLNSAPRAEWMTRKVGTLACASLSYAAQLAAGGGNPITAHDQAIVDAAQARTTLRFAPAILRAPDQRPFDGCLLTDVFTPQSPSTAALHYTYDAIGRVKEAADAVAISQPGARGPYRFYIADGYRGERVDPAGGAYVVEAMPAGGLSVDAVAAARMVRNIDELGRRTVSLFDGRSRVLQRKYPEGDQQRFKYDARDNVIELRTVAKPPVPPATALADLVVMAKWHETWNKPSWVQDARGARTEYDYRPVSPGLGEVSEIRQPAVAAGQPKWIFEYGANGLIEATTDPKGVRTTFGYNGLGDLKQSVVDPGGLGIRTCFGYDDLGNQISQTSSRADACPQ